MSRKNRHKIRKGKKILFAIIIILIIICIKNIVFNDSESKNNEKLEEVQSMETSEEARTDEQVEDASADIATTEDYINEANASSNLNTHKVSEENTDIKEYIETVMLQNDLSEENFGFFYYNMDNLSYYFYNEDTWFTAGSTIKVPLAMMYYDKINSGEITEDTTYKYYSSDYEAGAGLTSYTYSAGDNIPLSFLLEQMIVNSDNTATNILISGMR